MDIRSGDKLFRRHVRGFYALLGSLVAAMVLPLAGIRLIDTESSSARVAGVVLASLGWVPMTLVIVAIVRAGDEFQRRLHLVALGFAFAAAMLMISTLGWLVRAGFVEYPDLSLLWTAIAAVWLVCLVLVKRYYERNP
jgi:hypothetical protein